MAKTAIMDNRKDTPEPGAGWFGWYGRARQFLVDVRAELGRVTWPTRREVWATTVVVILVSALFGVYLYVIDLILSWIVTGVFNRFGA